MTDRLDIYIGKLSKSAQRIIRDIMAEQHEAYLDNRITTVETIRELAKAKIKAIKRPNDEQ